MLVIGLRRLPARPCGGDDARINTMSIAKLRTRMRGASNACEVRLAARWTRSRSCCSPVWPSWCSGCGSWAAPTRSRGMELFGLRSARQITEEREELEAEDLAQMLAAHNERRRRRGEADVTVADLERRVMEDLNEQRRRSEAYLADRDLDELLEATNARRRARGLPERTREEVQREFGAGAGGDWLSPRVARCLIVGCGCRGLALTAGAARSGPRRARDDAESGPVRRDRGRRRRAVRGRSRPGRDAGAGPGACRRRLHAARVGDRDRGAAGRAARHAAGHAARADARHHCARRRLPGRGQRGPGAAACRR